MIIIIVIVIITMILMKKVIKFILKYLAATYYLALSKFMIPFLLLGTGRGMEQKIEGKN